MIAFSANAQLVTTTQIPRTPGKPPVVFLNGFQNGCSGDTTFGSTFGKADELLRADGRVSLYFNNCDQVRNGSIEELGNAFRRYLESLRYTDAQTVPEVDVIVHSMGGLIVRSYLAGKQPDRGLYQPPAEVRIRKAVFVAVPNFGSLATDLPITPDPAAAVQAGQMRRGSPFLFDLATWNQGIDDLRGMDTVAVVGNAGTGIVPPLEGGFDDSTVAITSGSIEWTQPGRTRVVNYCHTSLGGLLSVGCRPNTSIAAWNDSQHEAARIALSFLNGTSDWQSIGRNVTDVTTKGGVFIQLRDAADKGIALDSGLPAQVRDGEIAWNDRLDSGSVTVALGLKNGDKTSVQTTVPKATTNAVIAKTDGPLIAAIVPNLGRVRAVAPGMFANIYGQRLAPNASQAEAVPYPTRLADTEVRSGNTALPLHYVSPTQINLVVPDTVSGTMQMTVVNPAGQQTVNLVVEPAVPTPFPGAVTRADYSLITASSPARSGDVILIYLTGLGVTERRGELDWAKVQPTVTVGGQTCSVLYAGRAPGYVGLDQINCQVAANAATGNESPIAVTSGRRTGTGTVALR